MYIFTAPAAAYNVKFTFDEAMAFIANGKNKYSRKLGTTITLEQRGSTICVVLYNTTIAWLTEKVVTVSDEINAHGSQATTWWIQKALTDNGVGGYVAREGGMYTQAGKSYRVQN